MVDKNNTPGLLITADEKTYAPPIARPQLTLDGSQYNNVLFSIGGRITFMNVGGYGTELRNDVIAGSEYGLRTEYYRPFRVGSHWFVAPRGLVDSNEFNAYTDSGKLASVYRVKEEGGAPTSATSLVAVARSVSAMKPNMCAIRCRLAKTPNLLSPGVKASLG